MERQSADTRGFVDRVDQRQTILGVIGLGYVGLPLVLNFADQNFQVIGFDIDPEKIAALRSAKSYIRHISTAALEAHVAAQRLVPTGEFALLARCDAILVCVPTPLDPHREPDLSFVRGTARSIAQHLRRGQLVVLESTTYPGTTNEFFREILESGSGLKAGQDFFLAFSPEREDPGNNKFATAQVPKIVSGFTPACREVASALYRTIVHRVVEVSSTQVAELAKLLENIFRSVNIALVNELKILCHAMGIDVWEVIDAAATKPFGFMPFYPGPGLGGHCIPIDPFYMTWKAHEYELTTRFIELAGEINASMPHYVVQRTAWALNQQKKPLYGAKILLCGVAYKADVDDTREAPAFKIIELLAAQGAQVSYHDPWVPTLPATRRYHFAMSSVDLTAATLSHQDAVIICTAHSNVDYQVIVDHAPCVVDTRNATRDVIGHRHRIYAA